MPSTLRSLWVGMLVLTTVIDPAMACRYCGQSWGYASYGSYYESSCCSAPCSSCGHEVVVSEPCGGCSSCQSCGDGQMMSNEAPSKLSPPMMAPEPPANRSMMTAPATPAAPSRAAAPDKMMPSTVHKPMESTPAPSMPAQTPPSTPTQSMERDTYREMPKSTEKPATPPQPAAPADDLFGAPSKPSDAGNDLFGAPSDAKAMPSSEMPAAAPSQPAGPTMTPAAPKASTPAADDLFGPPSNEPAAPAEKKSDAAPALGAPAEGEKAAPAEKDKKKDDDLFGGFGAILREPGGLASNEMREWVDNTGRFTCEGRLTRVMDGQVQLLKENGHNSTVPLGRLSQQDLAFVYRQASAERSQSADQTAQYTPAMIGE